RQDQEGTGSRWQLNQPTPPLFLSLLQQYPGVFVAVELGIFPVVDFSSPPVTYVCIVITNAD
ncbi:MAG: hypothetical protein OSB61_13055, partial [Verrucomicrobiota bacterium]|nr:hypothetical protein [Verrucomicrobiota bacterium]